MQPSSSPMHGRAMPPGRSVDRATRARAPPILTALRSALALLALVRVRGSGGPATFRAGPGGEFAVAEGWGLEPGGVRGTGARVWPASVALARYLAAHPHVVRDKRCVELGAGVSALPALAAARAGAASVVATEGEASALPLLRQNVASNSAAGACCVEARQLRWGDFTQPNINLSSADVILGADVVWGGGGGSREAQRALLRTLSRAAATRPSLVVLLSYCPRYKSEALFWAEARLLFDIAEVQVQGGGNCAVDASAPGPNVAVPHGAAEEAQEGGIHIYRLRPRVPRGMEAAAPSADSEAFAPRQRGTDTDDGAAGPRALSLQPRAGEGGAHGDAGLQQAGEVRGKIEHWAHELISDDSLLEAGGSGLHLDDLINPLDARYQNF